MWNLSFQSRCCSTKQDEEPSTLYGTSSVGGSPATSAADETT